MCGCRLVSLHTPLSGRYVPDGQLSEVVLGTNGDVSSFAGAAALGTAGAAVASDFSTRESAGFSTLGGDFFGFTAAPLPAFP